MIPAGNPLRRTGSTLVIKLAIVTIALVCLEACTEIGSPHLAQTPSLSVSHKSPAADMNCNYVNDHKGLNPNGGKQMVDGIQQNGYNFTLAFKYAGYSPAIRPKPRVVTCDYNYFNIPVPQGFTADWFGWWQTRESTDNLTFEPAALSGDVYSSTWVANTHYYLYVYITETGQLLESYETQGFNPKKGTVIFDSPFENGFVIPVNMTISLEIVHPSD
jgi:hypothetical protein